MRSDRTSLGIYEPFRIGARLYLIAPDGERVGFTFNPQKQEIPGLTYYTPAWEADAGVALIGVLLCMRSQAQGSISLNTAVLTAGTTHCN